MGLVVLDFVLAVIAVATLVAVIGFHKVPAGMVGLVTKRFGARRDNDSPKVSVFGAAGSQAQTLRANTAYWRPRFLYKVYNVPQTSVPYGTIGVVVARVGTPSPLGQSLAKYVECDHFQDAAKFLREGGEQGRQQQVLTGGFYDINTHLFDVITIDTPDAARREGLTAADLREIVIPIGETGVVVTHVGARQDGGDTMAGRQVDGHMNFQLPWEFLARGGQRGVQQETLAEGGRYVINPWFAHVVRIPSRMLILEWTEDPKPISIIDCTLEQIVLDVQGYTARLNMKQVVQIPAEAAPQLVRRFGDHHVSGRAVVQRFVEMELAGIVADYFRRVSETYTIQELITKYDEVCDELTVEARQTLEPIGVQVIDTTLEVFDIDPEIHGIRRRIAELQGLAKVEEPRLAELQDRLEYERVVGDVKAQQRKAEAAEQILAELAKANVPQIIGEDGDIAAAMLNFMPFVQAREILASIELNTTYQQNTQGKRRIIQAIPEDDSPGEKSVRPVPVSIYLASEANVGAVEAALVELLDHAGIDITETKPSITGSWFSLRIGRFKRLLTSAQVDEVASRLERIVVAQLLDKPQADIDSKQAEAVAALVDALKNQTSACIQVGSLFLIEVDDTLVVRNLSPQEMSFLSRNHTVLASPGDVLTALERLANLPASTRHNTDKPISEPHDGSWATLSRAPDTETSKATDPNRSHRSGHEPTEHRPSLNPPPRAPKFATAHDSSGQPVRPSETMTALGVIQDGDPILRRIARRFDLPVEAEDARRVITELHSATERISQAHTFSKGVGVAAPQIGIDRAAALVRPPRTEDTITLLNPTIVETSTEVDEQYEGCLSFFDIRCLVPRPLVIHVEHTELTGEKKITAFDRGVARLVAHEVDHLHGILCRDHLADGTHPISIEQYRDTGQTWNYSSNP